MTDLRMAFGLYCLALLIMACAWFYFSI